jgi:threonine dehydratase
MRDLCVAAIIVQALAAAMRVRGCAATNGSRVRGAGAAPLAAFLAGKLDALKGKDVVLVLCGGNIDLTMLDRVIEIGLVADGRLSRFTVSISDRPGGLARLAEVIASTGASIKEIVHDRAFSGPDLSAVRVVCVVETTGHDHVRELHRALGTAGMTVVQPGDGATAAL